MFSLGDAISLAVFLGAPVLGIWLYFRLFNNPNGERYLKMRNQGPFAPVDEDKDAEMKRKAVQKP